MLRHVIALTAVFALFTAVVLCAAEVARLRQSALPRASIQLKSPNGKYRILLQATDAGCGIWCSGPKTSYASISNHGDSPVVCLASRGYSSCEAALYIDQNGRGMVQLIDGRDQNEPEARGVIAAQPAHCPPVQPEN